MYARMKSTNHWFLTTLINCKQISLNEPSQQTRTFVTWKKLSKTYRKFWSRSAKEPPYEHVCQLGDPILRYKTEPVLTGEIKSEKIQKVISRLTEVSKKYKSVGLSAPQIGIPLKIFVMEMPNNYLKLFPEEIQIIRQMIPFPRKVFINPQMKIINPAKVSFSEACESLRGYSALVPRYHEIEISGKFGFLKRKNFQFIVSFFLGLNEKGETHAWRIQGWPARIAQHEFDHLEGKMYIDKMDMNTYQYDFWYTVNTTNGKHIQRFNK
uniref:Peptide deformylase n=1 Tax=Strigamia maritima TaxID=126957 RepID=T1IJ36_STRMM